MIRAVAARIAAGDPLELVIAGEGDQRAALQQLIDQLGMADRIRLLGFCEDLVAFYESLDLFVLSSIREGLPNVLLEAMAMGVPVLSTHVAGVPRLIGHERNGWLVECGDESGLGEAVGRLANDGPLRRRLAAAGLNTVRERFSFDERAKKQCQWYRELLDEGGNGEEWAAGTEQQ